MRFVRPPLWLKRLYPKLTWRIPAQEKILYLTFDDGPVPEITPWVLDQLKRFNAKAVFFCIGINAENNPGLLSRILSEGHRIGNHTYSHVDGWRYSAEKYFDEVERCSAIHKTNLFRPPYGKLKWAQLQRLKKDYKIIMWDVLSYDYDTRITPEQCLNNVIKNSRAGSIIVFHDSIKAGPNLLHALPVVLKHFSEKGFQFKALNL